MPLKYVTSWQVEQLRGVPKMGHGKSKSLRFLSPGALENLLLQMAGMCFNRGPSQAIQRRSFRTQNFDPGQVVRHQHDMVIVAAYRCY
jgi:hypothetical protein